MNLLKLAVAFCLMAGSLMFSQSAFGQSEEDKLKTHLYEFAKAYENLPQTKNKQSVLKYFDPGATSNIFVFNIRGKSGVQNGTVDGFSAFMDNLLRSNELSLKYTIVDVNSIEVVENIATAVYKVDYEIKAEDGIWVKGDETVTMAFEKKQGSWKIVHYTYIQREDEKLKGTCACRLFTEDGGDKTQIVSKTTIPAGKSYSTKYDNFELRTVDGNWMIKVNNSIYKRLKTGPLVKVEEDGERELGIPENQRQAVYLVIEKDLYSENCARLVTKKK